jgi:hypothetical protein
MRLLAQVRIHPPDRGYGSRVRSFRSRPGTMASKPAAGNAASPARPRPLRRGEPDQAALDVVAAPVAQHHRGFLVLHPFGDRLDSEPARQIDQRLHEGAIVGRARDVLHEGAVDLHDIDAELAQIPERGVAGAEIVDRDPAAEILQPRDEAATSSISWIATVSVISTISRSADAGMRAHQRFDRSPPVRIHRGVGRDVEAELHVRRGASSATTSSSTR